LLDDNPQKHHRLLHGFKVLGRIDQLPALAEKLSVSNAIIAMPSANPANLRRALEICTEASIKALVVPSYDDLISGKVTIAQLRDVELDDLLGRDPVNLNRMDLTDVTEEQVRLAVERLNHRPRKVLGGKSPHEVLFGVEMCYTKPPLAVALRT
jgi:FlaA1/EpsC-like NDP-sugar epimerase